MLDQSYGDRRRAQKAKCVAKPEVKAKLAAGDRVYRSRPEVKIKRYERRRKANLEMQLEKFDLDILRTETMEARECQD